VENLLKKYFWVLQLVLVLLIALLAALSVTNLISAKVAPLLVLAPPAPSTTDANTQANADPSRKLSNLDNAVWRPEPKVEAPPAEEPVEEPVEEPAPAFAEGEYPLSDLDVTLTGTTVASSAQWSMALVIDRKSSGTLLLQEGDRILEDAELVKIERDRIVIRRNNQLEQIDLESDGKPKPPGKYTPPKRAPASTPLSARPSNLSAGKAVSAAGGKGNDKFADLKKGIEKVKDGEYAVDRSVLSQVLTNPEKFKDGTQVRPNYKNGKPNGFRLSGLSAGSPLYDIGLRPGDVITAVNGTSLDSPNKALQLYQKMGNLSGVNNVSVTVERGGKSQNLSYKLK